MIAIDLSKQQVLDADPKGKQQIHFTGNLDQVGNKTICFIIEEAKKHFLFYIRKGESIVTLFSFNIISI